MPAISVSRLVMSAGHERRLNARRLAPTAWSLGSRGRLPSAVWTGGAWSNVLPGGAVAAEEALDALLPFLDGDDALADGWRQVLRQRLATGATLQELTVWSGAHRQTVVPHLVGAGVELRRRGLTQRQA